MLACSALTRGDCAAGVRTLLTVRGGASFGDGVWLSGEFFFMVSVWHDTCPTPRTLMLCGIVLDLDGTLVDSNYLHVEAFARALLEANQSVPRAVLHKQIGKGADQFLRDLVGDRQLAEQVDARQKELYRSLSGYAYPLPGARELLARLCDIGLQVWLGSSAQPEEAEQHLDALGARGRLT